MSHRPHLPHAGLEHPGTRRLAREHRGLLLGERVVERDPEPGTPSCTSYITEQAWGCSWRRARQDLDELVEVGVDDHPYAHAAPHLGVEVRHHPSHSRVVVRVQPLRVDGPVRDHGVAEDHGLLAHHVLLRAEGVLLVTSALSSPPATPSSDAYMMNKMVIEGRKDMQNVSKFCFDRISGKRGLLKKSCNGTRPAHDHVLALGLDRVGMTENADLLALRVRAHDHGPEPQPQGARS